MPRSHRLNEKGKVREKLLASATHLFNRRGYASTSVREIVDAAGVTKPVLYHYFGSKEGIYLEIMRHFLGHFEERLAEFRKRGGGARERVQELCDELFTMCLEHMGTFKLVYGIYYGPPQGAPPFDFDAFYTELFDAMRAAVKQGMRSGEFRRGNPADMTQCILGALTVAVESHMAHKPVHVGNRGLARILNLVFQGISSNSQNRKGKKHAGSYHRTFRSGRRVAERRGVLKTRRRRQRTRQ